MTHAIQTVRTPDTSNGTSGNYPGYLPGGNGSNGILMKILVAITVSGLLGAGTSIYTLNAQVAALQSENRANQKDLVSLSSTIQSLRDEIAAFRDDNAVDHRRMMDRMLSVLDSRRGLTRRDTTVSDDPN